MPKVLDRTSQPYIPRPSKHASGQAVVRLCGKDHYLGRYGSAAAQNAYDALIGEWLTRGRTLARPESGLTVTEVIAAYLRHAKGYYVKDGKPTSEFHCIVSAMRPVKTLYGRTPADRFDSIALQSVVRRMVEGGPAPIVSTGKTKKKCGLARKTINDHTHRIRRAFRWAAKQQLVSDAVVTSLATVEALKRGRTKARDTQKVKPVPEAFVSAIESLVSPQVWAMVQLQLLTGMRPGEVCIIRAADLDTSGKVWLYRPERFKTEHLDNSREVCIGPKAQAILKPWLSTDLQAYLFSPSEAEAQRNATRRQERTTPMTPSQANRKPKARPKRRAGSRYSPVSYRRAIQRACEKAKVPAWHPHRLRHNAATTLRREYGIEVARVILGHGTLNTTEIYAEADRTKAAEVMRKIG